MAQVQVWDSVGAAVVDGFRLFPAALRTGWPALLLPPLVGAGLSTIIMEAGGNSFATPFVMALVILFLFAPIYVRVLTHVVLDEPMPGWFSYMPGGRALAVMLAYVFGGLILLVASLLFFIPAGLALSADIGTEIEAILKEMGGWISIFGIYESDIENLIPLEESPLAASVLAGLGAMAFLWLWVKLTFIMPRAGLYGHFFPYGASFRLTRGFFFALLLAKILFFFAMLAMQWLLGAVIGFFATFLSIAFTLGLHPIAGLVIGFALFGLLGIWLAIAYAVFQGRLYRAIAHDH
jgi:hypothetical protein